MLQARHSMPDRLFSPGGMSRLLVSRNFRALVASLEAGHSSIQAGCAQVYS